MNSKPQCILPWTSLTLNPTGEIRQCISTKVSLGSIAVGDSIGSVWTSHAMDSLRLGISKEELPASCQVCKERERSGLLSRREILNRAFEVDSDFISGYSLTQGHPDILFLDIALSDRCNMWCRMCCSEFSNVWRHWEKKLSPEFQVGSLYPKDFSSAPNITNSVMDAIPYFKNLRKICFKGGEPFVDEQLDPFLDSLLSHGLASTLNLSFVTNASVVPESTFSMLKRFSKVTMSFSIDGTDKVYRYIRGNAFPLARIRENILKFRQLPGLIELPILPTIQPYNLFNLGELYQWCRDLQTRPTLYQVLVTPLFLHLKVLPESLRDTARVSLLTLKRSIAENDFANSEFIDRILYCLDPHSEFQDIEANRPEYFDTFVKFTKEVDKLRDQNIVDFIPEFRSLEVF